MSVAAILVSLLLGGLLCVLVIALIRRFLRQQQHSPRRLFQELCRAHRLLRRDVQLLGLLARKHALEQPARLFLEPSFLISAGNKSDPRAAQFQVLRRLIFGELTA